MTIAPGDVCPTCGHRAPQLGPKYATPEARRAGVAKAHLDRALARCAGDVRDVLWRLPPIFSSRQIGEACRAAGRHWSDSQATLGRLLRFGYLEETDLEIWKTRAIKRWRKTEKATTCDTSAIS